MFQPNKSNEYQNPVMNLCYIITKEKRRSAKNFTYHIEPLYFLNNRTKMIWRRCIFWYRFSGLALKFWSTTKGIMNSDFNKFSRSRLKRKRERCNSGDDIIDDSASIKSNMQHSKLLEKDNKVHMDMMFTSQLMN